MSYLQPTAASSRAAQSRTADQDLLRATFTAASFVRLRSLPDKLERGVATRRARRVRKEALSLSPPRVVTVQQNPAGTLAPPSAYIHSEYDRARQMDAQRRAESKARYVAGAGVDLVVRSSRNRPVSLGTFSEPAGPSEDDIQRVLSRTGRSRDSRRSGNDALWAPRASLNSQGSLSARSGRATARSASMPPLPKNIDVSPLARVVLERLSFDWGRCVSVHGADDGALLISFDKTMKDAANIGAYLNHMLKVDADMIKWGCRRDPSQWGVPDPAGADKIVFVVLPRVSKRRVTDAFFALHPDARKYEGAPSGERAGISSRVPFGAKTPGGVPLVDRSLERYDTYASAAVSRGDVNDAVRVRTLMNGTSPTAAARMVAAARGSLSPTSPRATSALSPRTPESPNASASLVVGSPHDMRARAPMSPATEKVLEDHSRFSAALGEFDRVFNQHRR